MDLMKEIEVVRSLATSLQDRIKEVALCKATAASELVRVKALEDKFIAERKELEKRELEVQTVEDVIRLKIEAEQQIEEAVDLRRKNEICLAELDAKKKDLLKERELLEMAKNDLKTEQAQLARDWKQVNEQRAELKKKFAALKV